MEKKEILKKIKYAINKQYPSAKIILYGSRARGDFQEYSDWDILILLKGNLTEDQKIKIFNSLYDIELETDQIFSPIIHSKKEWDDLQITPFYKNIQREGNEI